MSSSQTTTVNEFLKFEFMWKISKDDFRQLVDASKIISHQFWTPYNNIGLEWRVEFSLSDSIPMWLDFVVHYVDGPSENVRFRCSMIGIYSSGGCSKEFIDNDEHQLRRNDKFVKANVANINLDTGAYLFRIRLLVSASSFENNDKRQQITAERPDTRQWTINLYESIETADSKHSDVRLMSGDGRPFYCHRLVLIAQSELFDAMFRNARSEEERNGTFRLPTLTGEDLRKILEYFYIGKIDLQSSTIDQLMNLYDFAEQHGLQWFKDVAGAQLWTGVRLAASPSDFVEVARFAELHGMKQLKLQCFDLLAENYSRYGMDIDSMFDDPPPSSPMIEENSENNTSGWKERFKKGNNAGNRLRNELFKYLCGRIAFITGEEGKA